MIYLINTFNPHWEGHDFPGWNWPKQRVFEYMTKLLDGSLSFWVSDEIYAAKYGQIIKYNTLSMDIGVSVGGLKQLTKALISGYFVQYCFNHTRSRRKAGRTGKWTLLLNCIIRI